jgi:putative SOS response-associated peptidase YedK
MCSRYAIDSNQRNLFMQAWAVPPPDGWARSEIYPGYEAPFLRRPPHQDAGDEAVPRLEARLGRFGLLPSWTKDEKLGRQTYNARSETAAGKPSYRDAWRRGQHCIVPADAIYEPDWRSGRAVSARIARADGQQLGIAGLWDRWVSPDLGEVLSFTMLTVNADAHPFMCNYHRPGEEKRMVVLLHPDHYDSWLDAPAERSQDFMRPCAPDALVAYVEQPRQADLLG